MVFMTFLKVRDDEMIIDCFIILIAQFYRFQDTAGE